MNTSKFSSRRLRILDALKRHARPVSGAALAAELAGQGMEVSERTVRADLAALSREGAVVTFGKRGHLLSAAGRRELSSASTVQRIGFLSSKIDEMTFGMDFDLDARSGTVMVNTTVCDASTLFDAADEISSVFEKGYSMGTLVALAGPGETIGEVTVPEGKVGFCTVCSITINGILLKHGVPMRSRFGGLVEMRRGVPVRFAEAIDYNGTSLDPLVIFIRGGFTDYRSAVKTGSGLVGASFREFPASALDTVRDIARRAEKAGLGCFLEIGLPGRDLLGVPVGEGCCGAVVIGGLNPVSIMEERGSHVAASALSGFLDYDRLFHYSRLKHRLAIAMASARKG
ncbi:MAG: DUF128 domain-containing protein [Kiritimatiellae bacterium]|jgi:repressor of nif and glnA expression|nr:DUF128 domain-containing protein [Kiritimatiellia bacterium]